MSEILDYNMSSLKGETDKTSYCGYTCIGGRPEDQDCMAFIEANGRQVFAVCDGMGGHAGGCTASTTTAQYLTEAFRRQAEIIPTAEAIATAVAEANSAVYKKAQAEPTLRGMGTTLTLLVIDGRAAYVTHVGDSRIYQLRKGRKVFRTFDHSLVFGQVAKGNMTEEEARVHPRSNVLSRAIGILPDIEVTVTKLKYKKGDRFVLCCDGVWNSRPEPDIIQMFTDSPDLDTTIVAIRTSVERIGQENGGHHDNHTLIAVDMKCSSKYKCSFGSACKSFCNFFLKIGKGICKVFKSNKNNSHNKER